MTRPAESPGRMLEAAGNGGTREMVATRLACQAATEPGLLKAARSPPTLPGIRAATITCLGARESVLLELPVQGRPADAELHGRTGHVATRPLQGLCDGFALQLIERQYGVRRCRRRTR